MQTFHRLCEDRCQLILMAEATLQKGDDMEKKMSSNSNCARTPSYVRPSTPACQTSQICVRIPVSDKTRFEAAQEKLREHQLDMCLVNVIRDAMASATNFVESKYGGLNCPTAAER